MLLHDRDAYNYLEKLRKPDLDSLRRQAILRKIHEECLKVKKCPNLSCRKINGIVKKVGTTNIRLVHDKFRSFNASTAKDKEPPKEKQTWDDSFKEAMNYNPELERHVHKAMKDLSPVRVFQLFEDIAQGDYALLGIRAGYPQSLLWTHVPVPPVCIRPSVGQEGASTEDDLTAKIGDIVQASDHLLEAVLTGQTTASYMERWDFLTLQMAMYVNSDTPGLQKSDRSDKQIRALVQRLKGKQGRFRGNLSGKRVDYSGRTVISPDPNLNIDEVAIPELVAKNLTYTETVTGHNIQMLRACVMNGHEKWPGANYVQKVGHEYRLFLKYGNREHIAAQLSRGDKVERHVREGDIVLFNRQPSLHKLSIMSHYVRVKPNRTFSLNECVCTPYNADFDGDEMNLHVPQTEEARIEAAVLMGVKNNIVTPKNGEPIISAIQDFVTGAYLMTHKDKFFSRMEFAQICVGMLTYDTPMHLPTPTIIKPQALWTGKQIFNMLMRPHKTSNVLVNLDAQCRDFRQYHTGWFDHPDLQADSFLVIRNSEIMCGRMDKSTIGAGRKNSLFYVLYRDFGPDVAAECMNRLTRFCSRWLSRQGVSVGIDDVTPTGEIIDKKKKLIEETFRKCQDFDEAYKAKRLKRKAGLTDEETLEQEQVKVLSTVRTEIAKMLPTQLSKNNTPMMMAMSGAKGSNVNVAQMTALLGQQDIEGKRVMDGFQDRTLPHFAKHERTPESMGFISNSFFSGLSPAEFFFHAISGRVGLVDTAVKTAETGYMSRRLMKSMEDVATEYDGTVRNSASEVTQFRFGDDGLDPANVEASAKPVDLERTWTHVESTTFDAKDQGLGIEDVHSCVEARLSPDRALFPRWDFKKQVLDYEARDDRCVQQGESERSFLRSIFDFVMGKAQAHDVVRHDKADLAVAKPKPTLGQAPRNRLRKSARMGKEGVGAKLLLYRQPSTKDRFDLTSKITEKNLRVFVDLCIEKYFQAQVEAGHAVGAVGAQSIGEPGTQMTLKTFHFAGVAGMSLTAGVPRIKEIINASKDISTPVITCRLERRSDHSIPESLARIVKGRIESLSLEDIVSYIETDWSPGQPGSIVVRVSMDTIAEHGLDVGLEDILERVQKHRRCKDAELTIYARRPDRIILDLGDTHFKENKKKSAGPGLEDFKDAFLKLQHLKRLLPSVQIWGHPEATRAVLMAEDDPESDEIRRRRSLLASQVVEADDEEIVLSNAFGLDGVDDGALEEEERADRLGKWARKAKAILAKKVEVNREPTVKIEEREKEEVITVSPPAPETPIQMYKVMVEGYGLRFCMNTDGVDPYTTETNSIIETFQVLGIEAARAKIIKELAEVTKDLTIDPRHMVLLADSMTRKGEVLGITRFGLAKNGDSVLQLASFEKTADHLFDAAALGKKDAIEGVSESVIMGKEMTIGTGQIEAFRNMNWHPDDFKPCPTPFWDAWVKVNGNNFWPQESDVDMDREPTPPPAERGIADSLRAEAKADEFMKNFKF